MALCVWLFECARCHDLILLCTRCLGGRRYCDPCGEQAHRDSVLECGRRYQGKPEGREKHRLRQQRYRARLRERQQDGLQATGSASEDACTDGAEPSQVVTAASSLSGVTHRCVRRSNDMGVCVIRVPGVAAYAATEHAAGGDNDETQPSTKPSAETVEGRCEARNTLYHREHASCGHEAAAKARQEAAKVLAQLRDGGGHPVTAACCCCGRVGEVVVYDGQPRIIRGSTHGLELE